MDEPKWWPEPSGSTVLHCFALYIPKAQHLSIVGQAVICAEDVFIIRWFAKIGTFVTNTHGWPAMHLQQACHKESQLLHMSKVFGQTLVWELLGLAEAGGNFHPVHQGCLKARGYEMPVAKNPTESWVLLSYVCLHLHTFACLCIFPPGSSDSMPLSYSQVEGVFGCRGHRDNLLCPPHTLKLCC